jgi:hypothetical protein
MRVTLIAASVIVLGAFLVGFTTPAEANTSETVQQRTAAFLTDDNNGNG